MDDFPSFSDNILVLLFGWLLPFISGVKSREGFTGIIFTERMRRRFFLSNSFFLFLCAGAVMVQWAWHDRPAEAMGFRSSLDVDNPRLTAALISLLAVLYLTDLIIGIMTARRKVDAAMELQEKTPFLPRLARELPAYVLMCLAAGVCEEIIYRGFMVTYFLPEYNHRSGLPFLAVTAPAFLFSLAHYYQGWQSVLKIFLLSFLLGVIFLVSGSIWTVMIIHFLIDLLSGFAGMHILKRTGEN
jgi:membrane protease YdiL (CAAX protease family)